MTPNTDQTLSWEDANRSPQSIVSEVALFAGFFISKVGQAVGGHFKGNAILHHHQDDHPSFGVLHHFLGLIVAGVTGDTPMGIMGRPFPMISMAGGTFDACRFMGRSGNIFMALN